jgi:MFS family permease
MQILMAEFEVDMATGGWLMSIISLASLLLAIPAAFLILRLGVRVAGVLALSFVFGGSVMGALAPSAPVLLASRAVEGIGLGLLTVTGPTAISDWFEPERRGLAMGLWAWWVPFGNALAFNLALPLTGAFGWRSVWWFGAACALVSAVAYAIVVREAPAKRLAPSAKPPTLSPRALLSAPSWALALGFACFSFASIGYGTWSPTFLNEVMAVTPALASFYASLQFVLGIPANPIAGWAFDRVRDRYLLLAVFQLLVGLLLAFAFSLTARPMVGVYMVALGLASGALATGFFTLAPETVGDRRLAGVGVAISNVGIYGGNLIGPPLLGTVLAGEAWSRGSVALGAIMALGVGAVLLARHLSGTVASEEEL